MEGIRVYRANPGSQLLLSGGTWLDPIPNASILSEMAKLLGVGGKDLLIEAESRDTREQALFIKTTVTTNAFVLVTSAINMPRSMELFGAEGMRPQPAPADHVAKCLHVQPATFFPSVRSFKRTEQAFYEYTGIAWSRFSR